MPTLGPMPDSDDDLPDEYLSDALRALRNIALGLRFAVIDAQVAANTLAGARAARADELERMLRTAAEHTQRLITVVTGDLRADQP